MSVIAVEDVVEDVLVLVVLLVLVVELVDVDVLVVPHRTPFATPLSAVSTAPSTPTTKASHLDGEPLSPTTSDPCAALAFCVSLCALVCRSFTVELVDVDVDVLVVELVDVVDDVLVLVDVEVDVDVVDVVETPGVAHRTPCACALSRVRISPSDELPTGNVSHLEGELSSPTTSEPVAGVASCVSKWADVCRSRTVEVVDEEVEVVVEDDVVVLLVVLVVTVEDVVEDVEDVELVDVVLLVDVDVLVDVVPPGHVSNAVPPEFSQMCPLAV